MTRASVSEGLSSESSLQPWNHLAPEQFQHVRTEEVAEVVGDTEVTRAAPHFANDLVGGTDQCTGRRTHGGKVARVDAHHLRGHARQGVSFSFRARDQHVYHSRQLDLGNVTPDILALGR